MDISLWAQLLVGGGAAILSVAYSVKVVLETVQKVYGGMVKTLSAQNQTQQLQINDLTEQKQAQQQQIDDLTEQNQRLMQFASVTRDRGTQTEASVRKIGDQVQALAKKVNGGPTHDAGNDGKR